jgi:hypothetical protein
MDPDFLTIAHWVKHNATHSHAIVGCIDSGHLVELDTITNASLIM